MTNSMKELYLYLLRNKYLVRKFNSYEEYELTEPKRPREFYREGLSNVQSVLVCKDGLLEIYVEGTIFTPVQVSTIDMEFIIDEGKDDSDDDEQ